MDGSLCVSTIVNKKYQRYIPLFLYFCLKSYPNYGVKLFLTENIQDKYISIINRLRELGKIEIVEYFFKDFPKSNQELKTFRWLFESKDFDGYDYIYIGDIDLIICKEKISLLNQHLQHCDQNNLPYSNSVRPNSKRLSGLHFIKKNEYYKKMSSVIDEYRVLLKNGKLKHSRNEETLYKMIKKSGFLFPNKWFRPHHGIHLGLWRAGQRDLSNKFWKEFGKDIYKEYYSFFKKVENEKLYREVYNIEPLLEIEYMKKSFYKEFGDLP